MEVYFVGTNRSSAETQAIRESKPRKLLCSYFYFRTKGFKEYIERIQYKPLIMLDSGAWSAFTTGKNISLVDYISFIEVNKIYIDNYIALDVIGDSEMTYDYYRIMRKKGLNPIPVFHYGSDEKYLKLYSNDTNYIALGATVPIKDKGIVAKWINNLQFRFPNIEFHLLGSSSQKITMWTDIKSCDSSTWIMSAVMGNPKHIRGKVQKAKFNIETIQELSQQKQLKLF